MPARFPFPTRMGGKRRHNWVDRGEAPEPTLLRVLAHFLHLPPEADRGRLDHAVATIVGMVDADASEVLVAGYLGALEQQLGREPSSGFERRTVAIALWHVAKVARIRDTVARVRLLDAEPPTGEMPPSFSELIASRLLTPEEQREHAAWLARRDEDDAR